MNPEYKDQSVQFRTQTYNKINRLMCNLLGSLPEWYLAKNHEFNRFSAEFLKFVKQAPRSSALEPSDGLPRQWKDLVGELHSTQRLRFRSIQSIVRDITAHLWAIQNMEKK
jgi:hypothetical protein